MMKPCEPPEKRPAAETGAKQQEPPANANINLEKRFKNGRDKFSPAVVREGWVPVDPDATTDAGGSNPSEQANEPEEGQQVESAKTAGAIPAALTLGVNQSAVAKRLSKATNKGPSAGGAWAATFPKTTTACSRTTVSSTAANRSKIGIKCSAGVWGPQKVTTLTSSCPNKYCEPVTVVTMPSTTG